MLPSFFISYSFKDSEAAELFADRLDARGCVVWFAPSNMRAAAPITEQLNEGIYEADILLVLVSAHSVRSAWVKREISEFYRIQREHPERRLCPVRLDSQTVRGFQFDDPAIAAWVGGMYAPNFSAWRDTEGFSAAFDALTHDLDAVGEPVIDLASRTLPAGSCRTIGQEVELARGLSEDIRLRAAALALGIPDREGPGLEMVEAWSTARAALRRERTADNRAAEASRARVLTNFLKLNYGGLAGLSISTMVRKEIAVNPMPTVAPDLLKALHLYDHYANDDPTPPPVRKSWWPFGRAKH